MSATIAYPTLKAKYATVYDCACQIVQVDGRLFVLWDDTREIEPFTVAMAPFTVVQGDVSLADTQALWDTLNGGAARIACTRQQEVA